MIDYVYLISDAEAGPINLVTDSESVNEKTAGDMEGNENEVAANTNVKDDQLEKVMDSEE